jgi:hypothetical protein
LRQYGWLQVGAEGYWGEFGSHPLYWGVQVLEAFFGYERGYFASETAEFGAFVGYHYSAGLFGPL